MKVFVDTNVWLAGRFGRGLCADVLEPASTPCPGVPDPDDAWIIAAALIGGAAWFVTGDKTLLELDRVEHLELVSPREAYQRLRVLS